MEGYRLEKLSTANLSDLCVIYADAFGKNVAQDFLQKKQDTSFCGRSYTGYIAYTEQGEPAAFYGVYPCYATYNGKKFLVAQSGDTMTHSNHTGKGLFTMLAKMTYDYCRENGIHLVFGFPNQNSYPGFVNKLSWKHFDDFEAYVIPVKTISWYRINRITGLSYYTHKKWFHFIINQSEKGNPFESSCLQADSVVVDHSDDFFSYKKYGGNHLVKIAGLNVWLKYSKDFILIGDIEKADEKKLDEVVSSLKKIAAISFIRHIRFQGSSNTHLANYFKARGKKLDVKHPVGGINFTNEIPLERMKFTAADNDTF